MKKLIVAIALASALASTGTTAQQQRWVTCKNISTGQVGNFPDRCPIGWIRT